MANIVLCDDETRQLQLMKNLIQKSLHSDDNMECFDDPNAFLDYISCKDDIICFIDICLEEKNGIDVAKQINALGKNCAIVFISKNKEFFQDVYETPHVFFLTVPSDEAKTRLALDKAREAITERTFSFKKGRFEYEILLDKALYIENFGRYCHVVYADKSVKLPCSLKNLGLVDKNYLSCHCSYLINITKVLNRTANHLYFANGACVPISKSKRDEVLGELTRYFGRGLA